MVSFRSVSLTDSDAAQEVACMGMKILVSRRGLGTVLDNRAPEQGDCRVGGTCAPEQQSPLPSDLSRYSRAELTSGCQRVDA